MLLNHQCEVAVVLGSGWAGAVEHLGDTVEIVPFEEVFEQSGNVPGHDGVVHVVHDGERNLLVFAGRHHFYEHGDANVSAQPVYLAHRMGCKTIVLTNAAGGISFEPGDVVVITDHLNLTGASPLRGAKFVDMSNAYGEGEIVRHLFDLPGGVYAQFRGPQYETPAEVRMAGVLGADLVGMSTALETIAARSVGLSVVGLSFVTNHAAGIQPSVNHEDVVAMGRHHKERLGELLREIVAVL